MAELEEMFSKMEARRYDFTTMEELSAKIDPTWSFTMPETYRVLDKLVVLTKEVDIRLREYFLPIVRRFYMQCEDYHGAMRYFLNQEVFKNKVPSMPTLKICYLVCINEV